MFFNNSKDALSFYNKVKSVATEAKLHYSVVFISFESSTEVLARCFMSNCLEDTKTWTNSIVKYSKYHHDEYIAIIDSRVYKSSSKPSHKF